jgi:hypothetical protein
MTTNTHGSQRRFTAIPPTEALRHGSGFLKTTAAVVIVAFLSLTLQPLAIAVQLPDSNTPAKPQSNEEKLAKTLETIEERLEKLETKLTKKQDAKQEKDDLKRLRQSLDDLDRQAITDFDKIGQHIKSKNLPQVILDRHTQAVNTYKTEMAALKANLDDIEKAPRDEDKKLKATKAKEHLKANQKRRSHTALDPHNLPFSVPDGKIRKPKETEKEFRASIPLRPIHLASSELLPGMLTAAAIAGPSPADLVSTSDAQITPEIQALAAQLNHNPVEIYDWVHDNIEFIPTYGSIQGSHLTMETKRGNAFDTASLLIALLRASNIPARYVSGTVQIPADKVMNWVGGVAKPEAAQQLLGQGGIPNTGLVQGGKITHIKLEHVWVEAYVDFYPSRGAIQKQGDEWVAMDASFKQYNYSMGPDLQSAIFSDIKQQMDLAVQAFQRNDQTSWIGGVDQNLFKSMLTYADERVIALLSDPATSLKKRTIKASSPTVLSASLPYQISVRGGASNKLSDAVRHRFSYQLYRSDIDVAADAPDISYNDFLPNLAGKTLMLRFVPATTTDLEVIRSYIPQQQPGETIDVAQLPKSLPGYLIRVKAQLVVDGQVVQEGSTYTMGEELTSMSSISKLTGGDHTAKNHPIAGEMLVLGINLQGIPDSALINTMNNDPLNVLPSMARAYMATIDTFVEVQRNINQAVVYSHPSFGAFSTSLTPQYYFGIPKNVNINGTAVDIDALSHSVVPVNGGQDVAVQTTTSLGMLSSIMEHEIPLMYTTSAQLPGHSISAMQAIGLSIISGSGIYSVRPDNVDAILPHLAVGPDVKADVAASANAGMDIIVTAGEVTSGTWRGAGYVITDPQTGSGAYRISGGSNGGAADEGFNQALSLAGFGALTGLLVPSSYANVPDSCDGDDGNRSIKISWVHLLFFAIFMILLATLIAGSGGTLAPAFIKAFAALTVFFLSINRAMASGLGCPTYISGATTKNGSAMAEVTDHIAAALGLGKPSTLTYRMPIDDTTDLGDDSYDRDWYNKTAECNPTARRMYELEHGFRGECDEYPFYSTVEGGPFNYGPPNNWVSLRLVNPTHNSGAHGHTLSNFYMSCGLYKNQQFKVKTDMSGVTRGVDKDGVSCY